MNVIKISLRLRLKPHFAGCNRLTGLRDAVMSQPSEIRANRKPAGAHRHSCAPHLHEISLRERFSNCGLAVRSLAVSIQDYFNNRRAAVSTRAKEKERERKRGKRRDKTSPSRSCYGKLNGDELARGYIPAQDGPSQFTSH